MPRSRPQARNSAPAFPGGFGGEDRYPVIGDVFHEGDIGYHLRAGGHYHGREDWNKFFDFVKKKENQ